MPSGSFCPTRRLHRSHVGGSISRGGGSCTASSVVRGIFRAAVSPRGIAEVLSKPGGRSAGRSLPTSAWLSLDERYPGEVFDDAKRVFGAEYSCATASAAAVTPRTADYSARYDAVLPNDIPFATHSGR